MTGRNLQIGVAANFEVLLGGNQDDAVTVSAYARTRLLGLRWPMPAIDAGDGEFAHALAHVLKMEGGYTNDPYDPGGPTNKGITLAVLAAWRGITLDAGSRAGLIAELEQPRDRIGRPPVIRDMADRIDRARPIGLRESFAERRQRVAERAEQRRRLAARFVEARFMDR